MATEVTSKASNPKKPKTPKPGLTEAGVILGLFETAYSQITEQLRVIVYPPTPAKLRLAPHLQKRMEQFRIYLESITTERFGQSWLKFLGGMSISHIDSNGNIHLVVLDDGMLSDGLPPVGTDNGDVDYKIISRFVSNQVFGLDISSQRFKGKIHLHVFNVKDLYAMAKARPDGSVILALRNMIALDHGPSGNYMNTSGFKPFCWRTRCKLGASMKQHNMLVTPDASWFQEQMPQWLAS